MIYPQEVKYYEKTTTKDDEGQVVNSFATVTTRFQASVKPISLNQVQSAGWTVTDLTENSRFMAFPRGVTIAELGRIVDSFGNYYELRGVNPWKVFPQALLIPVVGEDTPVAVDGVSISPSTLTLAVGDPAYALTKTLDPTSPTNPAVTWSSSDVTKATVDSSGNVTAVAAGPATITVTTTDGGFTATCQVTVTP